MSPSDTGVSALGIYLIDVKTSNDIKVLNGGRFNIATIIY